MKTRAILDSKVVMDDGALLADALESHDRPPLYDKNGLSACENVTFTPEHKQRVLALFQPD